MSTIADRLEEVRGKRGVSRRGLAADAGVSGGLVAQIERGAIKSPRGETIEKLAKALNVDAGWLLTGFGASRRRAA
jgi:transcriptional regulator with XRE-family HTH domain